MLKIFIRYFFVILCAIYTYCAITDYKNSRKQPFLLISYSLFISLVISQFSGYTAILRITIMLSVTFLFLTSLLKVEPKTSLILTLISFALSYVFLNISGTIVSIFLLFSYKTANAIPYTPIYLYVGILQAALIYAFLRIKQIRYGIRFIIKHKNISTTTLLSVYFIIYISFISTIRDNTTRFIRTISISLFLFFAFLLIYLWRHRITQTYRDKLRLANEKSLKDKLNSQEETLANLEADNARLSQIVHKDNKIILAMLTAVMEHLENTTNATPDAQIIRGKELSAQLHEMANERQGILNTQSKLPNALPKSGLHTVDGMLSFMEIRAKEAGITYKLQLGENIKELAGKSIEEADLLHMLGDLIENSLIATKHTNNEKEILIHLGSLQGHFLLEISDSGIPFSLETYQRFGNEQHTTHSEDGGSGIGLMDIWKLKKKYKASLHIYEYEDVEGIYTKKLAFIFDRKNHFLLQTPRYKEATYALTRGDLYIFSNKEE